MRIAFCGKGGSGKTTASSLFVQSLLQASKPVLAIDADINQMFGAALGLAEADIARLPDLGTHSDFLKDHVRGGNPLISSTELVMKTTPPGTGSRMMNLHESNPVFDHYGLHRAGLTFLRVGGFEQDDIGTHCFHAKTGTVELLLNHMLDGMDDTIVVDMTAGADAFASGLFTRFDLTVLMVEPTRQSVGVFRQYRDYARNFGPNIVALGNKVEGDEDIGFLEHELGKALVGSIGLSRFVKQRERGGHLPIADLEPGNLAVLARIDALLRAQPRDWKSYWRHAVEFHLRNAESWANAMTGQDLGLQIDRDYLDRLSA